MNKGVALSESVHVWPPRYRHFADLLVPNGRVGAPGTDRLAAGNGAMVSEGRLLWLTPLEWSLLLISAALCGCLSLVVGA